MSPNESRGFTLLEMMIAVSISTLLMAGVLTLVRQFELAGYNLQCLLEREQNLRLAPLILSRLVPHGGNQRWRFDWPEVSLSGGELEIRSDIDGTGGFPDGEAAGSYEDIQLRVRDRHLQIRSGRGSFQPFLRNITGLRAFRSSPDLVELRLTAQTDPMLLLKAGPVPRQAEMVFWLRNFQPNLFAEAP